MQYGVKSGSATSMRTACAVVGVYESHELDDTARELDQASKGRLRKLMAGSDLSGKIGQTLMLGAVPGVTAERVLLVGLGAKGRYAIRAYRRALQSATTAASAAGARDLSSLLPLPDPADALSAARHAVEAVAYASYRFTRMKSEPGPEPALKRFAIAVERTQQADAKKGIRIGEAIATGVALTRDLGNLPANVCTPSHLADVASELANKHPKLSAKSLTAAQMQKLGMGALLSVGRGSRRPPRLILLEYRGAEKKVKPVVFVGKGVTFDTGGICIKPAPLLDEMKYDMCGAGSVLGTMAAVAALAPRMNVVGVVPAAENMPDGDASLPGDIVTTMSGKTVEILNTDAEGRLLLCDAITYARKYHPEVVIDVATLTGACVIALGEHYTGLMSTDDALAEDLLGAAARADDRAWRLPLDEDYLTQLKTNFADIANVGGRPAGAITAGCFLAEFARDLRWAHLDIAGTAWQSGKSKGGTGRPVPLLVQFLLDRQAGAV